MLWQALFSLFSLMVPLLGNMDFQNFDQAACERVACPPKKRMFLLQPMAAPDAACPVSAILAEAARAACEQPPAVPVWLLATCDYGYVFMLALTCISRAHTMAGPPSPGLTPWPGRHGLQCPRPTDAAARCASQVHLPAKGTADPRGL